MIKIWLAMPPLQEQLAIVGFLDRELIKIDELIHAAKRAIDLLLERRTALIAAAVTGKIDVHGLVAACSETEVAA
jgi:type I restriction enzyme S subunit